MSLTEPFNFCSNYLIVSINIIIILFYYHYRISSSHKFIAIFFEQYFNQQSISFLYLKYNFLLLQYKNEINKLGFIRLTIVIKRVRVLVRTYMRYGWVPTLI